MSFCCPCLYAHRDLSTAGTVPSGFEAQPFCVGLVAAPLYPTPKLFAGGNKSFSIDSEKCWGVSFRREVLLWKESILGDDIPQGSFTRRYLSLGMSCPG